MSGPGRNDPCPCGSGKKYKRCCLEADRHAPGGLGVPGVRRGGGGPGSRGERDAFLERYYDCPGGPWWDEATRDWQAELYADLDRRLMLPDTCLAGGGEWGPTSGIVEAGLNDELARRWLLWRDDLIEEGMTDPRELGASLLERQREWETTPRPELDGRTPAPLVSHLIAEPEVSTGSALRQDDLRQVDLADRLLDHADGQAVGVSAAAGLLLAEVPGIHGLRPGIDDPVLRDPLPAAELEPPVTFRGGGRENLDDRVGGSPDSRVFDDVATVPGDDGQIRLDAFARRGELHAGGGEELPDLPHAERVQDGREVGADPLVS